MTRALEWFKKWVRDIATTPALIVIGICLAIYYVVWSLGAATFCQAPTPARPDPWCSPIPDNTLETLGLFIWGMITGGVAQFATKRFSDHGYAAIKKTGPTGASVDPTTTAAPRNTVAVSVQQGEPA